MEVEFVLEIKKIINFNALIKIDAPTRCADIQSHAHIHTNVFTYVNKQATAACSSFYVLLH